MMIPTEYDYQWLANQLADALAAATGEQPITINRTTAELLSNVVARWLDQRPVRAARYNIDAASLLPAVADELRRLASGGEAPSKARWDIHRQRTLPTAQHICRALGQTWIAIAAAAGLRPNRYAQRSAIDAEPAAPAPAEPQPPILDEFTYCADWPTIKPKTQTETITVGNMRITREFHTLR